MHNPATPCEGGSNGLTVNTDGSASAVGSNGNNRFAQGTVMTRDYNRNPREDGPASRVIPDTAGQCVDVYTSVSGSRQQQQRQRSISPRSPGDRSGGGSNAPAYNAGGPALAAFAPFMTCSTTDEMMEGENDEMERRLRQEILNHLSQEYVLFPKDAQGYKLSRLRLLERDMVEYLQHVHDEIQSKQENCIVCMDHVPTVILLPCKHKVMCRLCAPSCPTCPVCRSKIAEMFEPEEI
ncbi:hypothetical protein JKF63_06846 [Porcisia hertigi]|uniref:RING-type domain-containing protein n=1 Tax=Porcisia hertigi TaxID=2761500 RepID=A0A836LJ77_9TRYP|nr:hypothetical protein JKF63_06846 [Porcisia hertigi]